jgi:pSer/pThr/pTyr-binding forkhead associated (FHA) protein
MSRLTIFRDDSFLEEHMLMRAVVALGRHPENDLVLDDRTLSRFHARLERRGDLYVVVDLGAQNGVFLNGSKIQGESPLMPGDRIGMGRYVAIFDQDSAQHSRRRGSGRMKSDSDLPSASGPAPSGDTLADPGDLGSLSLEDMVETFDHAQQGTDASGERFEGPTTAVEVRVAMPALVLLYNGLEVSRHSLIPHKPLVIGRSKSSDLVISLLGLSRRHAIVTLEHNGVIAKDLGSQNGTWVNNERIDGTRVLKAGDMLNFYEYGIVFVEDPNADLGVGGAAFAPPTGGTDGDALASRETGRQGPPSVITKLLMSSHRHEAPATQRLVAPQLDDGPSRIDAAFAALGLGEGSYLDESFDGGDGFDSSLDDEEAVGEGTDLVPAYEPGEDGELSVDFQTETRRTLPPVDAQRGGANQGARQPKAREHTYRWPSDDELEDALSQPPGNKLASLEVYLGDKLYTQMPLSNPVTRIGSDARCELALPARSRLCVWHLTLVNLGAATVCYRASKKATVLLDGEPVDQVVLQDGDSLDLGKVRLVYRCR